MIFKRTTVPLAFLGLLACSGGGDGKSSGDGGNNGDGSTGNDSGVDPQDAAPPNDAPPNPDLSFFATSTGSGAAGGDLGGLAGADSKCQSLANQAGGAGRTWRAYLSTGTMGPGPIVHARDRIGSGPWSNANGQVIATSVTDLHSKDILGNLILDEKGNLIPSNEHDILTGSNEEGRLFSDSTTCNNWTDGTVNTQGQVGHADIEAGDEEFEHWISQHSGSCDEAALNGNAGTGRIYCFAID